MSGSNLLLDTNVILYLLNGDDVLSDFLDGNFIHISFITELELCSYHAAHKNEMEKINRFLADVNIIDFNAEIKDVTKNIRRMVNIKLPDAIIAATGLYKEIPLLSADRGFRKIETLNWIFYEK